ncbi:MAG: exodeoxyribonuclease V subunit gamma [Candidatus Binatia bacterium]
MFVHRSNRAEELVDALTELVSTPLADPFAPETIAVPGLGMARWLSLELARRLGVWANPAFPFPRKLIDAVATAALGSPPEAAALYAPETLVWAVADELPRHLGSPSFAPLRGYLDGDDRGRKRQQLAARVADLFDQYAVFRPDMVIGWEGGAEPDDWQAVLWRALVARLGRFHPAARARDLLAALRAGRAPAAPFPSRISLFGLSTLPPLYVQILAALAQVVELHLFVLSPTDGYWGDLLDARRARRLLATSGDAAAPDQYVDVGHPLLASLGRVGREFAAVLEAEADYDGRDRYAPPPGASALAMLQADILALQDRGGSRPGDPPRLQLAADDDSIAFHACHSPMREVEVLHDQLAALLDADPSLQPHDIAVMAPSIDAYAPLIEAIFTSPDRPPIPFRTADRGARARDEVLDALLRALELLDGKLPASALLDLLALDPVRARFDIAAEELERMRRWIARAGVRWGADARHRVEEGLPPTDEGTWHFGLRRLLLGYALPEEEDALCAGVRPCGEVEGGDARLLGRMAAFAELLMRARETLSAPRSPADWRAELGAFLAALVAQTPANTYQHEAILTALDALAGRAADAGFTGVADLWTMRRLLEREVAEGAAPRGFLTGAVTVCELVPMRSIPFRVVCAIGLNDGVFPRTRRPLGFDRIAASPRPGDRSPREDDRYLFLEVLLSARERLLITYVGQRVSDNVPVPPSVVVSELRDAIDRAFIVTGGAASAALTVRHPLQPFSPRYFTPEHEPRLFSFAAAHCRGARALVAPPGAAAPFVRGPLAPEPIATVDLEALIGFLENPSRAFLRDRLELVFSRDQELLDDATPVELNALERWAIGDKLLDRARAGADLESTWARLRAEGGLPLGAAGRAQFEAIAPVAAEIAGIAARLRNGSAQRREVDLSIGDVRLAGEIADVDPHGGLVVTQYSRLGRRHELRLWVRHLALCAASDRPIESTLVGCQEKKDAPATVRFAAVADARAQLAELLALYAEGLRRPLPLFACASRAYAAQLRGKKPENALNAAADAFSSDQHNRGDAADAYVAQLYPDLPECLRSGAASEEFARLAVAVYGPLLEHRSDT